MNDFDRARVNKILAQNGFGEIESVVIGGRDGAYSTVYALKSDAGEPEKVLKLYKREIAGKQIVKGEFETMQRAFDVSNAFPIPYAFLKFEGCENPRFGDVKETLYGIVMEKLDALSFNSSPSNKEILLLLKDLLEEVVMIHRGGFRHGDIKTSNIMWCTRTGKYTLIDFNTVDTCCNTSSTITSNSLCGSRYYIDPESINITDPFHYSYSPRSDIYALGMTARVLMNNNRMEYSFKDTPDNNELLEAKRKLGPFKSRKYSKELCSIVSKATAFERDNRFDDAQQMLDAVVGLLKSMGVRVADSVSVTKEKTVVVTAEEQKASVVVRRRAYEEEAPFNDIENEEEACETDAFIEEDYNFNPAKDKNNISNKKLPLVEVSDNRVRTVKKPADYSITSKINRVIKAIRDQDYDTALRILEKSKDKYTNFFRGCAYLGKKDYTNAEKEFDEGKDKMSYYMLYCLNNDNSPEYAVQCLETASSMQCAPAMFYDGYRKYKSADASEHAQGLSLIVQSAQLGYLEAYRYLIKLQRRQEISSDLVENIPTEGLTKALSYFAN